MHRTILTASIVLSSLTLSRAATPAEEFFTTKVQPILETSCVGCHSGEKPKGKLNMTTLEGMKKGGKEKADKGIVVGKPDESTVYTRTILPAEDDDAMPPKDKGGPLSDEQKEVLKKWITDGATVPAGTVLKKVEKKK
jgi:uncharacterized membrane protein